LLRGSLQPVKTFRAAEAARDFTSRLARMEDARSLPWGLVWEEYCRRNEKPADGTWLAEVKTYENNILGQRI
ncbi:MAG: L-rhamnose isomerase, partial [Verrucomicrobiota bacterium]